MSQHRILGFKPHLRLEWRGQDGQSEAEQPDHPASLGDSNAASHSDQVFGTHSGEMSRELTLSITSTSAGATDPPVVTQLQDVNRGRIKNSAAIAPMPRSTGRANPIVEETNSPTVSSFFGVSARDRGRDEDDRYGTAPILGITDAQFILSQPLRQRTNRKYSGL
jgi:hypothetical protein